MRFIDRGSWAHNPTIQPSTEAEFFTYAQLQTRTIESLKGYLRRRIGGYAVAVKDMPTTNRLYRGRICKEWPQTIDDVSYPKPHFVRNFGRANRIGHPMFYCSIGSFPVFFEIHAKPGDHVALSEWALIEPLWMHNLGYHAVALGKMLAHIPLERLPLVNPIPNETNRNARLRQRMSLAFTKNVPDGSEYQYKETIAINELLFDRASPISATGPAAPKIGRVAGTAYPSVMMEGLADNVAIWPEFVDRHIRIKSVKFIKVESADAEKLDYSFLVVGRSRAFSNGTIIWDQQLGSQHDRRTQVAFINGQWVFRDGLGRVYDVH